MAGLKKFGDFEISQCAEGNPIELSRLPNEFVFLALDTQLHCLVELHILRELSTKNAEILALVKSDRGIFKGSNNCFSPILKSGVEDNMSFYTTPYREGELLQTYIARIGALSSSTVFGLVLNLLDNLASLKSHSALFDCIDLKSVHISLLEDTFLRPFVVDYHFEQTELNETSEARESILVNQVCVLLFNMLTGKTYEQDNCDDFPVLRALPSGLRTLLRSNLLQTSGEHSVFETLRGEVRNALMAQCRGMGDINARRHLIVEDAKLPQHTIKNILLNSESVDSLLSKQFKFGDVPQPRDSFVMSGISLRTKAVTNIQLLPPKRILQGSSSAIAASELYRIDSQLHPNLYPVQGVWEGDNFGLVMEEKMPGISLSRLLLHRSYLNYTESFVLLEQVSKAIVQAQQCEVPLSDLHPRNLFLRFESDIPIREMEKMLQKRLDVWPKVQLVVRSHLTMMSFNLPLILDDEGATESGNTKNCLNRNFIALAACLLTGDNWVHSNASFSEAIPHELVTLIKDQLELSQVGEVMSFSEFLKEYERFIPENEGAEVRSEPRLSAAVVVEKAYHLNQEEVEHVGAVSDFDEDNLDDYSSHEEEAVYMKNDYRVMRSHSKNMVGRFFEELFKRRRRKPDFC